MNAAILLIFGALWLVFAYFWYGKIIHTKVLKIDDSRPTPSNTMTDGKDYVPTKPSILFGHHFSSIAGAGPIVGPIIAFAFFGWLPALIWILVGSVFMGAVHDFTALVTSIRHKGYSIVQISESVVSPRAMKIFAVFVWLALALIQAVFAKITATTFVAKPEIVVPTFGIMLIAVLFGIAVIKKGFSTVAGTIIALAMLFAFVMLGDEMPIEASFDLWFIITIVYSFVAASLPVWLLLQPRDYLSMYLLVIGLALALVGILVLQPTINAPAFISFDSATGPMFPMLFIIIACGAISGFHSLVASGTSSKQLAKESDARFIGYGSMLTEGLLALLVILMISSVLAWSPEVAAPGQVLFHDLLNQSKTIVFGQAFGITTESLGIPLNIGVAFGVLMLNAFLLTTLDTSARLSRYIVQETMGQKYGGIFKNPLFCTGSGLILAYLIIKTGGDAMIWPVFGTANQLIGAMALFVISAYLLGIKSKTKYTIVPGFIMMVITIVALIYQIFAKFIPQSNWILLGISVVLLVLALVVTVEVLKKMGEIKKANK